MSLVRLKPGPLDLKSSTLPLSPCAPQIKNEEFKILKYACEYGCNYAKQSLLYFNHAIMYLCVFNVCAKHLIASVKTM